MEEISRADAALLRLIKAHAKGEDAEVRGLVDEMIDLFEAGQRFECRPYRERIRGLCYGDNYALLGALAHMKI